MNNQSLYRSRKGYETMMALYEREVSRGPTTYESHFVPTRFGTTHLLIGGPEDGEPLFLLHGWNGNGSGVGGEFPFLFSTYRVYMPDIPGHTGKSAPNRLPVEDASYAEWMYDVLDALSLERVRVMGTSGGGWVTLKFAAYHSHRIQKAVALSTDGLASANILGIILWMLPAAIMPNDFTVRRFMRFMTAKGQDGPLQEGFVEMLRLFKHFKTQRNPGLLTDDELRHITTSLLVLMGKEDRVFPAEKASNRARRLIPGLTRAEIVPKAGHMMTIDQPDFISERVMTFFG